MEPNLTTRLYFKDIDLDKGKFLPSCSLFLLLSSPPKTAHPSGVEVRDCAGGGGGGGGVAVKPASL